MPVNAAALLARPPIVKPTFVAAPLASRARTPLAPPPPVALIIISHSSSLLLLSLLLLSLLLLSLLPLLPWLAVAPARRLRPVGKAAVELSDVYRIWT